MILRFPAKSCTVMTRDKVHNYWAPVSTGHWASDCDTGRRHADTLIDYVVEQRRPELVVRIVGAMVEQGKVGGCETGFLQRLGERLLTG